MSHDDEPTPVAEEPTPRPRSRRRRVLRWSAAIAFFLASALVAFVWFALATDAGARWLFTRLGGILPGELDVARLEGPIRGPLVVHGLLYETDSMRVRVDRLYLEWRLRELLEKRLDVHELVAEGVDVATLPGPETAEEGPLPDINLRFNVIVRDARVRDMVIRREAGPDEEEAEPFVIDAIDLATVARGGLVDVQSLTVRSPDLDLEARGTLRPQGAYDVDLETRWTYRSDNLPTLAGGGSFGGTLERLRVRQELSEPFPVRLDALLRDPLYQLGFDVELAADDVRPTLFGPDLPELTADLRLTAEGTLEAFSSQGLVAANTAEYGPVRARFEAALAEAGEDRRIEVRDLVVTRPGSDLRLAAAGEVTIPAAEEGGAGDAPPPRFDLTARWTDFAWPLSGEPTVASSRGQAEVAGTADDYRLSVTAALAAGGVPPGTWSVRGRGDGESLEVASFEGGILGGRLAGSGNVRWEPRVEWDLSVAGSGLDPSALAAEYPGDLALSASTTGHLADAGPVGRVELARLAGTVRGEPVAARGLVILAGETYRLEPLEAAWAENRVRATGSLGERYDLAFRLEAPNPGVALTGATGLVEAEGTVTGPAEAPRVEVAARGESLAYGGRRVADLQLDAAVDLAPEGPITVDLVATGLDLVAGGARGAERLTLTGRGTRGEHAVELDLVAEEGEAPALQFAVTGGLDPAPEGAAEAVTWRGRITRLTLDTEAAAALGLPEEPPLGTWSLEEPAGLVASLAPESAVRLSGFCWSGRGRVCADGAWSQDAGWSADATLARVPLALAATFLPPDVELTGDVDGTLSAAADAAGRLRGELRLAPGPGVLVYPAASAREQRLRFDRGTIVAEAGDDGVTAVLDLDFPEVGELAGRLELPGYRDLDAPLDSQPIAGRLTADLADVSFVGALVDGITSVGGRLDADLTVSGTVGAPDLRGRAVLADGQADYPEYGLELRDLQLTALADGEGPVTLDGSVRSGAPSGAPSGEGGLLRLAGSVPLVPGPDAPARLTVAGRRFEVIDTEEMHVFASPDLTLTYDGSLARVTGEVLVPEAEIEIAEREEGAVTASDDVVFVGPEAGEPQGDDLAIAARVRVVLGDDVEVRAFGLRAEPTGSVLIVERPDQPTLATGELDLAGGTFKAYGQDLTIERGRLIFAGPLTEPGIDLRAYRRADDGVVAGLEATGTLEKPVVTLWSEPPMSQGDQLSYVLLGRPLGAASESDGDLLANAATSLGIKGGNLLGKRLAARFGLEEARIETDGSLDQASVVLGKYLSPRLYVGYGIGLFEAVNTFRIRYLLSDELTLEAETGAGTSADLLYTVERGRGAKREAPPGSIGDALEEQPEAPAEEEGPED